MATSLFFDPSAPPPEFANYAIETRRGEEKQMAALQRAIALNRFGTETVPDIIRAKAARGAFWTGAPSRAVARAAKHLYQDYGTSVVDLERVMHDLIVNQPLLTTGLPLPPRI